MIAIRPLTAITEADLLRLIRGYTASAKYVVAKTEAGERVTFTLEWVTLARPYVKRWDPPDPELRERYLRMPARGFSFGAYDGETLAGLALAEPQAWNRELWIWEFHVAVEHQRRGLGRRLMEAVAARAHAGGMRCLVVEVQNTNAPAIQFYRAAGFAIEAVDLSYYTNADLEPGGEVALFMKRRLE